MSAHSAPAALSATQVKALSSSAGGPLPVGLEQLAGVDLPRARACAAASAAVSSMSSLTPGSADLRGDGSASFAARSRARDAEAAVDRLRRRRPAPPRRAGTGPARRGAARWRRRRRARWAPRRSRSSSRICSMWSSTLDSSAAIRSTSSLVELKTGEPGDVEHLVAVEHRRPILVGRGVSPAVDRPDPMVSIGGPRPGTQPSSRRSDHERSGGERRRRDAGPASAPTRGLPLSVGRRMITSRVVSAPSGDDDDAQATGRAGALRAA